MTNNRRKPEWLKIQLPMGQLSVEVMNTIRNNQLNTICTSGRCPNQGECWGCGTATFIEDLGASHWVKVIESVKRENPNTTMEVLIPDFQGRPELVAQVIAAKPEVISHNLETVRRLSDSVRSRAKYDTSLQVLKQIADSGIVAKSGIMLGLGETREEILETMDDLRAIGCRVMTIGQYLQPTAKNIEVKEYIRPEVFEEYKTIGLEKGFSFVESGPLVRSSYHAERHVVRK